MVNLMNEARRVYYNQFIEDDSTDQGRLFAASKSLLNMKKDRSLPHIRFHCLQTRLPVSGQSWTESLLSTPEPNLESESGDIVFSHFQCQTTDTVRHMITSGKNKSCILDPIPASLLSSLLDSLLPVLLISSTSPWRLDILLKPGKLLWYTHHLKSPTSIYCSRIFM